MLLSIEGTIKGTHLHTQNLDSNYSVLYSKWGAILDIGTIMVKLMWILMRPFGTIYIIVDHSGCAEIKSMALHTILKPALAYLQAITAEVKQCLSLFNTQANINICHNLNAKEPTTGKKLNWCKTLYEFKHLQERSKYLFFFAKLSMAVLYR